jgi:hypothetical protein
MMLKIAYENIIAVTTSLLENRSEFNSGRRQQVEFCWLIGNRPLEPRALEVEFFPMEEVLHEKVKIH